MNETALANLIASARSQRVGVIICSDSNAYTNGGWEQAVPLALRNYAPICGYVTAVKGHAANIGWAVPGQSANADRWSVGETEFSFPAAATSGAPAPQEALFPRNAAARQYQYIADGATDTAAPSCLHGRRLSGIDYRRALRYRMFGASFESGETAAPLPIYARRSDTPYTAISPVTNFVSVTGSVGRISASVDVAADAARDLTLRYGLVGNWASKVVGPMMLTGASLEVSDLDHGWVIGMHVFMGGNSPAENIDDMVKSRAAYQEHLRQMRDTLGADAPMLVLVNLINDKGGPRTVSASWQYGGIATGGTANTIEVADATGLAAGMRITVRDATTLGYVDANSTTSVQDRVIDSVVGNVLTATVAFTRTPLAGDVWRASAVGSEQPTEAGRGINMRKLRTMVSEDCLAVGLTPLFVDLPQWPSGTDDARVVTFESASDAIAVECADWVSTHPSTWLDPAGVVALGGADMVHPGSYFLASFLQHAVAVVQTATVAAQLAADVAEVQAATWAGETHLGVAATGGVVAQIARLP